MMLIIYLHLRALSIFPPPKLLYLLIDDYYFYNFVLVLRRDDINQDEELIDLIIIAKNKHIAMIAVNANHARSKSSFKDY